MGHKVSFNRFQRTGNIQTTAFEHSEIKLKINNKKLIRKKSHILGNTTHLNTILGQDFIIITIVSLSQNYTIYSIMIWLLSFTNIK